MIIVIDPEICTGCGLCVEACPQLALRLVEDKAVVDLDRCDLDGICIPICPVHAIGFRD